MSVCACVARNSARVACDVRPDITGDLYPLYSANRNEVESGALKYGKQSSTAAGEGSLGETMWKSIAFNASSSSALFGRSDTNQMASLRLLAIVKY